MPTPKLKQVADDLAAHLTNDADGGQHAAVAVLDAVASAVAGYDDPRAELSRMATALRHGGQKLVEAHPGATTEVFDRAASLLDSIARAV